MILLLIVYSSARVGGVSKCIAPALYFPRADGAAAEIAAGPGEHHRAPDMAVATAPPDLFVAARRHHLGRERAVQILRPLCGDPGLLRREVVEPGQHAPPGAVRAARPSGAPRRYRRLIRVALGAEPPDLAVAVRGDLLRRERGVKRRVPLRREPRLSRGQIVEAREHGLARAVRAARALHPGRHPRLPYMAARAAPPDLARRGREHVPGRQRAVLLAVPFRGEGGVRRGEVVLARAELAVRADGAARPGDAGLHGRAPAVALRALPPHVAVASWKDDVRPESAVLLRVPLGGGVRLERREVVAARDWQLPRAVGAAGVLVRAARRAGLIQMPLGAPPPVLNLAAVRHFLRPAAVLRERPLIEQSVLPVLPAMLIERFPHGIPLSSSGHNPPCVYAKT